MGNKIPTPESWVNDLFGEKRNILWGKDYEEKIPYPSFWPAAQPEPTNQSLATLVFGKVFQFPILSPQIIDQRDGIPYFPKINFSQVDAPSVKMLVVLSKMQSFKTFWKESIEKRDIYYIIRPVFDLMKEYEGEINNYLIKNLYEQLNFFGLVDGNSNYKIWFEKKLIYLPDNFRLASLLFILCKIEEHFENDNAPFLEWKQRSENEIYIPKIPNLPDFQKQIPLIAPTYGNFWLGMNGKLKNVEEVEKFWTDNHETILGVLGFKKAMKMGHISFGGGGDYHTDFYNVRMSFFKILKYKKDGQDFFKFPFWSDFVVGNKFLDMNTLNSYIRNYFYLMVHDIQVLIPDIWDKPISVIQPRIPWTDLSPIDDSYLERNFLSFKEAWKNTALYFFFETNRPIWPPGWRAGGGDELTDAEKLILDFIKDYTPPPLKVPPFSFTEWKRLSSGWENVFELQWDAYFHWARVNAYARSKPNYVNPGEQLKNKEGELLFYRNERGEEVPLVNTYPDYGIMRSDDGPTGRGFRFLLPWAAAADWIWGDDFWDTIKNITQKVFKLIIDALIALYEIAAALLPSAMIILAILAGVYFVVSGKEPAKNEET